MFEKLKEYIAISPPENDSGVRKAEEERQARKQFFLRICALGSVVPLWLAYVLAPLFKAGIGNLISGENVDYKVLYVHWCRLTFPLMLFLLLLYLIVMMMFYEKFTRNYRFGEEYGSAKWGDIEEIKAKYEAKEYDVSPEKQFMDGFGMSYNSYRHRLNLNSICVGGSGAGKTRFFAKPNLLNAARDKKLSFVVLDPKGELTASTGNFFIEQGYKVKVLDFVRMERSHCYNPFVYLRNDDDIQKLVTNLFKSLNPKDVSNKDPFWDNAAGLYLKALVSYIFYFAPKYEQNFNTVLELMRAGVVEEDQYGNVRLNALDRLFADVEARDPQHIAVRYYKNYHHGAAKTLQSIQITLVTALEKFEIPEVQRLTSYDEMELDLIGERNTVVFAIIPDNDTSYNFLVSILYTQIFQRLYYCADVTHEKEGKTLPYPVHFLMDEFSNVSLPDDFESLLSTMRSRGISCSIILQNLAQIKAKFEKTWESVIGNCDTLLYLGGNEKSTHQFMSEYLGKETIDTRSTSEAVSGSSNGQNYQGAGRELLTPDEVRMLNNDYCLLFMRGNKPVIGKKYDLKKHPNLYLTSDGGAEIFEHGLSSIPTVGHTITVDGDLLTYEEYTAAIQTEKEFKDLMSCEGFSEWFNSIDDNL